MSRGFAMTTREKKIETALKIADAAHSLLREKPHDIQLLSAALDQILVLLMEAEMRKIDRAPSP